MKSVDFQYRFPPLYPQNSMIPTITPTIVNTPLLELPMILIKCVNIVGPIKRRSKPRVITRVMPILLNGIHFVAMGLGAGQFLSHSIDVDGEVVGEEIAHFGVLMIAEEVRDVFAGGGIDVYIDGCGMDCQ